MNLIKESKMNGQQPPYHLLLLSVKTAKVPGFQQNDGTYTTMQNFSASQSLRQKFLTSNFNDMSKSED